MNRTNNTYPKITINKDTSNLAELFGYDNPEDIIDAMDDPKLQSLVLLATYLSKNETISHQICISTSIIIGRDLFTIADLLDYWNEYLSTEEVQRLANLLTIDQEEDYGTNNTTDKSN